MNPQEILKYYFGYDSFKEGQERIINTILSGRDVLAVMPTGSGKSVCYQVPALMLPGITLVISPLISLMQDQVKALNEAGIHAGYINSSLTQMQIYKVYDLTLQGRFKILYVAPERLENEEFLEFANNASVSMITVDEAHCISQWGQDFRPSYLKIVEFIRNLRTRPVISAFTATATREVRTDIVCVLGLRSPEIVVTGFDRPNLYYSVETVKDKDRFILDHIEKHPNESGIIYCATRKNVDMLYSLLCEKGIAAARYHAGMDNAARMQNQNDFIYDRRPVIAATNAFGMGIDKSNVRYVIHYNMPQSMENYYQEAGRAGRDSEPSQCILLFSVQDIMINKFLLDHKEFSEISDEDIELIKQRDARRLRIMEGYCRTTGCLRNYILEYFGENPSKPCDNCGNCHREFVQTDMTEQAKHVINCVYEARGRYGISIISGTLKGADRARLRELGTVSYRSYGALKGCSEALLRALISQMIADGYLYQTEGQYSVLRMGNIDPLKKEAARVMVKMPAEKEVTANQDSRTPAKKRSTDSLTKAGFELFDILRALRLEIAGEEAVPPYIIFSDKTLAEMCVRLPKDKSEMLSVSGVGEAKLKKYADRFISEIEHFLESNPGVRTSLSPDEEGSSVPNQKQKIRKTRDEFYIRESDCEKFVYKDLCYITELKDELNRICTAENVKKLTGKLIFEYLAEQGFTEETAIEGRLVKTQTEKGRNAGIVTVNKINQAGNEYTLLMYPPAVQKLVMEHFTQHRY